MQTVAWHPSYIQPLYNVWYFFEFSFFFAENQEFFLPCSLCFECEFPWQVILDSHSRCLLESTTSRMWPCSSYWVRSTFFFVAILNTTHLMELKLICQVFFQCSNAEKSFVQEWLCHCRSRWPWIEDCYLQTAWFTCWISFAPVFSLIYCWVLILALTPCYILIYMF